MQEWALILIAMAVFLFVLELLIPSGGILGFLSAICLIGSIICTYQISTTLGVIATLASMVIVPAAFLLGLKVFPHTPVGRLLILKSNQKAGPDSVKYDPARDEAPNELIGARGEAVSGLRPVGTCNINGRRIECLSVSGVIDPGTSVEVTSVQGIEVRVKAV